MVGETQPGDPGERGERRGERQRGREPATEAQRGGAGREDERHEQQVPQPLHRGDRGEGAVVAGFPGVAAQLYGQGHERSQRGQEDHAMEQGAGAQRGKAERTQDDACAQRGPGAP